VEKPVPIPSEDDRPYWDALKQRRLVLSRCTTCGWYTQRSQAVCVNCRGEEFEWSEVSGRAKIYTWAIARQTWVAGFEDELPYVTISVAIEEQPQVLLTTNLTGDFPVDHLAIGLAVIADYEPRGDEVLLQFRVDPSRTI
jgi:uncharacterized OB-fold protein